MGAAMMVLDIKTYSIGGLGVFVFPSLIGPDGNLSKVIFAIIIAIVGGVLAFLIQLFVRVPNLYGGGAAKGEEKAEEAAPTPKEIQQEIIARPLIGNVVAFLVALLAIKFFISFVTKYGFRAFGYYRIILSVGIAIALLLGANISLG